MFARSEQPRRRRLSQDAAEYLESLAMNVPVEPRQRRPGHNPVFLALSALGIALAVTIAWTLLPFGGSVPSGDAKTTPGSPCRVEGQNLTIPVDCDDLNQWLARARAN